MYQNYEQSSSTKVFCLPSLSEDTHICFAGNTSKIQPFILTNVNAMVKVAALILYLILG